MIVIKQSIRMRQWGREIEEKNQTGTNREGTNRDPEEGSSMAGKVNRWDPPRGALKKIRWIGWGVPGTSSISNTLVLVQFLAGWWRVWAVDERGHLASKKNKFVKVGWQKNNTYNRSLFVTGWYSSRTREYTQRHSQWMWFQLVISAFIDLGWYGGPHTGIRHGYW